MNKRAQSVGALCVGVITRASSFPGSARALACKFRRLAEIRFFQPRSRRRQRQHSWRVRSPGLIRCDQTNGCAIFASKSPPVTVPL